MTAIGAMAMPYNFKYASVYLKGRPRHEKFSSFWRKHVPMDTGHRAKIFAPFDALAGFDEAIASKETLYVPRKNVNSRELNKEFDSIAGCTAPVTVSCFVPCTDPYNSAFAEGRGTYKAITGVIEKIDRITETIRIGGQEISLEDVGSISEASSDAETR